MVHQAPARHVRDLGVGVGGCLKGWVSSGGSGDGATAAVCWWWCSAIALCIIHPIKHLWQLPAQLRALVAVG